LAASHPSFIVDGLGEFNRHLAVSEFADLNQWMAGYREIARTANSVIYRRQ
jgi:DNA-binding transcriptional regulator YdaS (Cro superfamily)